MNPSYNDSFGSSGSSNGRAPITSSGQDIILTPSASPQKSPRRGLIIAGIVLIIVAIVAAIAAVVMNNNNSGNNTESQTAISSKQALDRYIYFYLSGDAEGAAEIDFSNYSADNNYLVTTMNSGEIDIAYLAQLQTYHQQFYNNAKPNIEDEDVIAAMDDDAAAINFLISYYSEDYLDQNEIIILYEEDNAVDITTNIQAFEGENDNNKMLQDLMAKNLELIKIYGDMGCVSDSGVDYDCAIQNTNIEAKQLSAEVAAMTSKLTRTLQQNAKDLYYSMFNYSQLLNMVLESDNVQEI